jgi:ribosomal-protein-alanine N-acetyltransferase
LSTARLDLIPLNRHPLQMVPDKPEELERDLGCPVSRDIVTGTVRRAIRFKLEKMTRVDNALWDWYTYWLVVVRDSPFGAGLFGFKGFPDRNGEAEIGYGIDPAFQGRGYSTEAVIALIGWAFEEPACRAVVARDVLRSNLASQRVLAKAGMKEYSETETSLCYRID